MTDSERNSVGVTLAGKNQYRVLASIMQNFSHAIEATETALRSEGSALKENSAYMESIEAKTTRVKALFQDFSREVVDSDAVKGILDLAAGFLQIANTDLGHIITQFTLLSGVVTGISGMIIKGLGLNVGLSTILSYIAIAVGAFVGLYNVIKLVQDTLQEKADAKVFDNVNQKIEESIQKIEDYNKSIKDSKDKLKELNETPFDERTPEIDAEIARLEALISTYERLKEEEKNKLQREALTKLEGTQYATDYTRSLNTSIDETGFQRFTFTDEQIAAFDEIDARYNSLEAAAWKYAEALKINISETDTYADVVKKLADRGVILTETYEDFETHLKNASEDMKGYVSELNYSKEPSEKLLKNTKDIIEENSEYYKTLKSLQEAGIGLKDYQQDFINQYEKLSISYEKASIGADAYAKAIQTIKNLHNENILEGTTSSLEDYVSELIKIEGVDVSNVGALLETLKQTGQISLDYTEEELQDVLDKVSSVDGSKAEIEVDADTEAVFDEILSAEEELEAKGITITSSSDADALLNSLGLIQSKIQELSSQPVKISVNSDMSKAITDAGNVSKAVKNIPSNKTVYIGINVSGLNDVQSAASSISGIYSKSVTITINVLFRNARTGEYMNGIPNYATGSDYFSGGKALVNDGTPVNGSSAELVVANGKANIYNNGEPTVVNLPRGAKIYTAAETQEILKNNKAIDNLQVPSFADGNVTIPAEINAQTIVYDASDYYRQNVTQINKTKEAFDNWQKEKKHLLELDLITQEQYYLDLEYMNENYLKDVSGAQDEYWRYQEEIYKWKKSQLIDENELLERQIELEKALQDVAKAKTQKILVYKDGKFQYMADIDAIAEAQRNVAQIKAKGYAGGTTNATAGLHLVGEKGPELRVLNGGDGIIPADATKNLLEIAKMGITGLSDGLNKTLQNVYNFAIDNLSLPDVKNPSDFLEGLKNYAYQYSYAN